MKKKKWLYVILLIILVGSVLFFYNAFNGNPISKIIAKSTLENHLESNYPDDEFIIQRDFYNFKDGGYNFYITKVGEEAQTEYEFIVTGILGLNVHIDGIYYANQDERLIRKLVKQANKELTIHLQESVSEVLEINVQMEVQKGKYPANTSWSKEFKPEHPMYVHITLDAREFSKEDTLKAAQSIQKSLDESGYRYDTVMINGNFIDNDFEEVKGEDNWYVKHVISFEKGTKLKVNDVEEVE